MFVRSTSTPVKDHATLELLPANNRGNPGIVQVNILFVYPLISRMTGSNTFGKQLNVYKDWNKIGLPDQVTFPVRPITVFCLKNRRRGYKNYLNMSLSTY